MPKPKAESAKIKSTVKSSPFAALLQAWRDRKAERDNIKARTVTDATARAENLIISELASIDFLNSKLPKEDLKYKQNPNSKQEIGDLEYATLHLVKSLKNEVTTPKVDLCPINRQLLLLAQKFKYADEKGDSNAAFAAKAALVMGIEKVRSRVPETQPDQLKTFIENSAEYLAHWVTEVDLSAAVDQTQRQVNAFRARLNTKENELENLKNDLEQRICEDADFAKAFDEISRCELAEDRKNWTAAQLEAHDILGHLYLCDEHISKARQDLYTKRSELQTCRKRVEDLKGILAVQPSVFNGFDELMNQYSEILETWFMKLKKIDFFSECLKNAVDRTQYERALDEIIRNIPEETRTRKLENQLYELNTILEQFHSQTNRMNERLLELKSTLIYFQESLESNDNTAQFEPADERNTKENEEDLGWREWTKPPRAESREFPFDLDVSKTEEMARQFKEEKRREV